jgi:hypothetical protein
MIKPVHLSYFCILIAVLCLASAFAIAGFILGSAISLVVGAGWGIFSWRKWTVGTILSMLMIVLGISLATISGGSRLMLLISLLATLAAWDLDTFHNRLAASKKIITEEELVRAHLLRLISVLILGVALPSIAFALQFDLKFWQVFLLGMLLLLGLSQVFVQLKRSNQ